jgi:tetratricopeptide (TPR) repeat protein
MNGLPQGEQVRAALEELLSWPPIARSPQLGKFLSYIVTTTLEGQDAQIKAYSIAVDVFGRPATFDPQSDPIVRVQARRLRTLLEQYYAEGNGTAPVRIVLPVGRYVPEFLPSEGAAAAAMPAEPQGLPGTGTAPVPPAARPRWLMQVALGGILTLAVGIGVLATLLRSPAEPPAPAVPSEPIVLVGQFANLTGTPELDSFGLQVASAVRESFEPFEDVDVLAADPARAAASQLPAGAFLLSGVVHPAPEGVEVTATLSNAAGEALWNATYDQPPPRGHEVEVVAAIARAIARELGPFRGPVHAGGRAWLDAQPRPLAAVNTYVCLITYHLARESGSSTQIADALACVERLLREQPDNPLALAASAWLEMRAVVTSNARAQPLSTQLERPLSLAERAVSLAPDSSIAYEHLGAVNNWLNRYDDAERDFVRSLALNPLNTDARAGYGITLGRALQWALGSEQAAIAIADAPYAPAWYYYPIALNAFREGRFTAALDAARRAMSFGGGEAGTIIAVASAQSLGRKDVIAELQPRLMAMESLRRTGIMPWFATQISDPEVLASVAVNLGRAGVPQAALTGAF